MTICGDGANHSIIKYAKEWVTGGKWVVIRIMPDYYHETYNLLTKAPTNWDTDFGEYFKRGTYNDIIYILETESNFSWEANKYYTKVISNNGDESYELVTSQVNWEAGKYYTKLSVPSYERLTSKPSVQNWANNTSYYIKEYNYDKFLHDIVIKDLGVVDTDAEAHAQSEYTNITQLDFSQYGFGIGEVFQKNEEGAYILVPEEPADWSTNYSNYYKIITIEETHGFDIQCCYRAKVLNCGISNVGDEAIDMHRCIDSLINGNTIIESPAIGNAGGAISIGDGCNNVIVSNNSVNGSVNKKYKNTFGIAIESLNENVKNILLEGNTITNIHNGMGINIAATSYGANLNNINVYNNIITNTVFGINIMGSKPKENINITSCSIDTAKKGIYLASGTALNGLLISNFNINNCTEDAIRIVSDVIYDCNICNGIIKNMYGQAIYCASHKTKLDNILINGVGLGLNSTNLELPAIQGSPATVAYATGSTASNITILNCKNNKGIENIHTLINPIIEQEETNAHRAISGVAVIRGGRINRIINGIQNNGIIDGITIQPNNDKDMGNVVINISNKSKVRITNCLIDLKSNLINRKAISETGSSNNNIIANNIIVSSEIVTIGANTINKDNIIIPKS